MSNLHTDNSNKYILINIRASYVIIVRQKYYCYFKINLKQAKET